MKVRANEIDWEKLPEEIRDFAKQGQTFVTPGKEYTVLAMSVFQNVWFVLICDDYSMAEFLPLHLFTQVSMDIPPEWICNLNPHEQIDLILGPDFVAKDVASHSNMVDKYRTSVDELWRFYDVLLERERAETDETVEPD